MRVLHKQEWRPGYLDYHRGPGELRVRVQAWCTLERLTDMYFVRPRSVRLLWNYVREVGPLAVARKVVSRGSEGLRNEKFVSCGWGTVLEAEAASPYAPGDRVCFVATAHPRCVDRITVPDFLVAPFAHPPLETPEAELLYLDGTTAPDAWWAGLRAWSPFAGRALDPADVEAALDGAAATLRACDWTAARRLPASSGAPRTRRSPARDSAPAAGKPTAVLFGYGNYAKTLVLPNLAPYVQVRRIHEVDPTQVPRGDREHEWDSSPAPEGQGALADAYLIAGFHHTHAPLAARALRAGAYAVVEKPVAVDEAQLDDLLAAMRGNERLFSCFQKRYMPFNEMARRDLKVAPGEPVSYHCIVFEVPLPERHWYRWPNSRSRVVSNGCHWLDHFLYLNDFAPVEWHDSTVSRDGTINTSVQLANGAFMTMTLTDRGSARLGVQDLVELRANDVTVRLLNGAEYFAEDDVRVLRRARVKRLDGHDRMYREIGRRIAAGLPGDSIRSVEVSAGLTLAVERSLPPEAKTFSSRASELVAS